MDGLVNSVCKLLGCLRSVWAVIKVKPTFGHCSSENKERPDKNGSGAMIVRSELLKNMVLEAR